MTITATRKPLIGSFPVPLPHAGAAAAHAEATFVDVSVPSEIRGLDGLVVSGEPGQRRKLVEEAVDSGVKAILCQSPLAATIDDAQPIVDTCRRHGVRLAVAFPYRYSPAFQRLREQVMAGAVGEVIAIRATSHGVAPDERKSFGGVVLDRAVHVADLNHWLIGGEATEVYAEVGNHFYGGENEDTAFLSIKYGDVFATFDARWSHAKSYPAEGEITLQVVGTGGVLDLDMFAQGLALSSAKDGSISWPGWGSDINAGMLSDFTRLVAGEETPNLATAEDALRALEAALAAYRSAERKEPVSVGQNRSTKVKRINNTHPRLTPTPPETEGGKSGLSAGHSGDRAPTVVSPPVSGEVPRRGGVGFLLTLIAFLGLFTSLPNQAFAQKQRMADPSYFYPGPLWTKLEAAAPTAALAIINPASGPGDKLDPNYVSQVKEAKAHGLIVLGYVHTSYAKRNLQDVEAEAEHYFQWYHVSGIFYDEVSNDQAGLEYYKEVFAFTKKTNPQAMDVLNPGTQVIEGYMKTADIICTFESGYAAYQKEYNAPAWVTRYPASRFWHIVLNVPTDADMKNVVHEAKARHAGWVYVTSATENPNPYDTLPASPYWSDELAALASAQ